MHVFETTRGGLWTGKSRDIDAGSPRPPGWQPGPLPALSDGQSARWTGSQWVPTDAGFASSAPTKDEQRAAMRTTRGEFALAAHAAGIITAAEAEAWAGGNSLPQAVTDALATAIPDATERLAARIEALTTTHVRRTAPLLVLLQSALSISDTDADALFG